MRDILSRYVDCPPDQLDIGLHPGGKPYLGNQQQPQVEFNLSHSRDVALLAVTTTLAVGIDVEVERKLEDPLRLAERRKRAACGIAGSGANRPLPGSMDAYGSPAESRGTGHLWPPRRPLADVQFQFSPGSGTLRQPVGFTRDPGPGAEILRPGLK
jgi:hypothetical protein